MPQALENFESAEELLEETKENNIKYPKLIYLKGLASKRISAEISIQKFEESSILFSKILKTDQNYFISQAIFEMGQILKKQEKFKEA